MAFEEREVSIQDGEPIELYEFMLYGQKYRFTSASEDYTFDSQTYLAATISHDEFEQTSEVPKNNITLQVPHDFTMLEFYENVPPSDVILLTIFQTHRGDGDSAAVWVGRVINGLRKESGGELYCENVYTSLRRQGLRRTYGRLCPHVLYGPACKAQDTAFRITVQLDSVGGSIITSSVLASYPDDRFAGGLLEWEQTPGRIERRGLKSHVGNTAVMTHPIPALTGLVDVYLYPGCKHNRPDCNDFFDNIENYGGFPFGQRQNPMGNTSVF